MDVAAGTNLTPILAAIGAIILGGGGVAGVLTALATRRNYVTTGFRSLTDASATDLAAARAELRLTQAAADRAETMADRWRDAYWALRYEVQTAGHDVHTPPPAELPPVTGPPPTPPRQP